MSRQHDDVSTTTSENQFGQFSSSIPYMDSSSLDDENLVERDISSTDYSRRISFSDTDLFPSFQDNLIKQSDDDLLFLEWDKERHLFQDYINSLRKEIRVLLQERLEYQQQNVDQTRQPTDEQMKIDLLQKSLEEKNFIIEQLQNEYERTKEKNNNLIKKLSLTQCDSQSYIGIIDELKQKLADLTIDLQNHVLVKRRLEMSITNLENDCKMIDTERIRLTNDIKQNQHQQQDLEKVLQKANVQIAEQGSTIEMLRSENVQVRSQLSTIQRRMFQEKQQILDYLRQIENDLIEKEQIKLRESSLRQDYEQLKTSIDQDQQKLKQLQQECAQLLQTIENQNEEKHQVQSDIKDFYTHFHLPIPTDLSVKNLIQSIENRFDELQSRRLDSNVENLAVLTAQCTRLEEANQAWQQFHQVQLDNFRNKLRPNLPIENDFSLDEIAQSIIDYLRRLPLQRVHEIPPSEVSLSHAARDTPLTPSDEVSIQSTPSLLNDHDAELRQLRETNALLMTQCTQLDQANRAWQQYQLGQLDSFRNKLRDHLPLEENTTFDQAAQLTVDLIDGERRAFQQRLRELENTNEDLRSESAANLETIKQSYINTVDELTQELSVLKEALDQQRNDTSFEQIPFSTTNPNDILRNYLEDYFSIDYNLPLEEIVQQIVEQLRNERYQNLEKENDNLRSGNSDYPSSLLTHSCLESMNNLETIRQSHLNTIDELNRELLVLKEQLSNNKNNNPSESSIDEELRRILSLSNEASLEEILSSITNLLNENNTLKDKQFSLIDNLEGVNQQLINVYQQYEQLSTEKQGESLAEFEYKTKFLFNLFSDSQVQENFLFLQNQCAQLDDANRAWQQFYDNQLDFLREQLKDYIHFEADSTFNQIIQTIVVQLQKTHPIEVISHGNGLSARQSSSSSSDSEQIEALQEEIQSLKNQLTVSRMSIESLNNILQVITDDNDQLKQRYHEIEEKYLSLIKDRQNAASPIRVIDLVRSSPEDEIQQLQGQMELFRATLEESIPIDSNSSLEQIAQEILRQFGNFSSFCFSSLNLFRSFGLDSQQKQLVEFQSMEQSHVASETIPIIYQNNQTQIDRTEMIDQENQTESPYSIVSCLRKSHLDDFCTFLLD